MARHSMLDSFFFPRKRRRLSPPRTKIGCAATAEEESRIDSTKSSFHLNEDVSDDADSTDIKLAILLSLFPHLGEAELLDILVSCNGAVETASDMLSRRDNPPTFAETPSEPSKRRAITATAANGIQTSLSSYTLSASGTGNKRWRLGTTVGDTRRLLTKKGKTLNLFTPEDIAEYTPCSIIHNFLPQEQANTLLMELLEEARTFERYTFKIFNNTAQSPHTGAFFVADPEDQRRQTSEYVYNGTFRTDVRRHTPQMRAVSEDVRRAVNAEIQKHIQTRHPAQRKLKYQSPSEWVPNVAIVNCYNGPEEGVGYHSDELTYLGPRAIIGSLSLGVAREFRVRKVVARGDDSDEDDDGRRKEREGDDSGALERAAAAYHMKKDSSIAHADAQGQISIHLPHNSLLVMHAEMQEEWKHSIPTVQTISPHPIAGNRRINITYRWHRESLHPSNTPRCQCGVPTVLRCVQRKRGTRGRYMWMCYAGSAPGKEGCSFFQWAKFDDDGEPIWNTR